MPRIAPQCVCPSTTDQSRAGLLGSAFDAPQLRWRDNIARNANDEQISIPAPRLKISPMIRLEVLPLAKLNVFEFALP